MDRPLIAVIDQDIDFIELMEDVLSEEGYATLLLNNMKTAYKDIKAQRPALAVVDTRLSDPESSFALIDTLRLDPETAQLPIIICSTDTQLIHDNEAWLHQQNCDILMKPFGIDELYTKVATFIGRR